MYDMVKLTEFELGNSHVDSLELLRELTYLSKLSLLCNERLVDSKLISETNSMGVFIAEYTHFSDIGIDAFPSEG